MSEKKNGISYFEPLRSIRSVVVWNNGEAGMMNYHGGEIWHQFIKYWMNDERTDYRPEVQEFDRNIENCPVVSEGIISFTIVLLGKDEKQIFETYYQRCLKKYKQVEGRKPGASLRDLDEEFYPIHISEEKDRVKYSQKLCPYIHEDEMELLNEHADSYFDYIRTTYAPKKSVDSKNKTRINKDVYSSKEWCVICYYSNFSDKKGHEYNTDVIKAFHAKHKVPYALTTFIANFNKVKRHIEVSEKQAIKLIEKILPHFSKNKSIKEHIESQLHIIKDDVDRQKKN